LLLLHVTASDWPFSLEIRGPRYPRRYETQILEVQGRRRSRWFLAPVGDAGIASQLSPDRPFAPH